MNSFTVNDMTQPFTKLKVQNNFLKMRVEELERVIKFKIAIIDGLRERLDESNFQEWILLSGLDDNEASRAEWKPVVTAA